MRVKGFLTGLILLDGVLLSQFEVSYRPYSIGGVARFVFGICGRPRNPDLSQTNQHKAHTLEKAIRAHKNISTSNIKVINISKCNTIMP